MNYFQIDTELSIRFILLKQISDEVEPYVSSDRLVKKDSCYKLCSRMIHCGSACACSGNIGLHKFFDK